MKPVWVKRVWCGRGSSCITSAADRAKSRDLSTSADSTILTRNPPKALGLCVHTAQYAERRVCAQDFALFGFEPLSPNADYKQRENVI